MKLDIAGLKEYAAGRLDENREGASRLAWIFALCLVGVQLAAGLLATFLSSQADHLTGLSAANSRTILQTLGTVISLAAGLAAPLWKFGYQTAMLDQSRGKNPTLERMTYGFRMWGRYLNMGLLLLLRILLLGYVVIMVGGFVGTSFVRFPAELDLQGIAAGDPAVMEPLVRAVLPLALVLSGAAGLILWIYLYRFRLAPYLVADKPELRGGEVLQASSVLMKGVKLQFLKLDLSFWWYYLAVFLVSAVPFLDVILLQFGVVLPMSAEATGLLLEVLTGALNAVLIGLCMNKVQVTYAAAYDQLIAIRGLPESRWIIPVQNNENGQ